MQCIHSYALGKARRFTVRVYRRNGIDIFINLKNSYDEEKLSFVNLISKTGSNGYLL